MPVIRFPYVTRRGLDSPIVCLGMRFSQEDWHKVWAYVDSGSIYSIFREDEAGRLDITIEAGERKTVKVGDGHVLTVYLHALEIQLGTERFGASVGFARGLRVGFNILGRLSIFDKFKVCFDDTLKIVTFHPK